MTSVDPIANIDDLARLAGVSTASVSRALNGKPGVSSATRKAITRLAQEHGYKSSETARALSAGRTGRIAVTLPVIHAEYFARILAGASETLQQRGLSLMLETTGHNHEMQLAALGKLMRSGADGALLLLPAEAPEELRVLHESGFPFVLIDSITQLELPVPWITCTHRLGARQAVEHLLELEHTRIGVVTGELELLSTQDRLHGVRQALGAAGLELDPDLVFTRDFKDADSGYPAGLELLDRDDPPTAIFAFNDLLAFGVLRAAAELGIAVPGELSVIGFDDLESSSLVTPGLTTVRQPLMQMGALAAELLISQLDRGETTGMHIELPTELVVRGSTSRAAR
jgi:LacI family transcriptional regulator